MFSNDCTNLFLPPIWQFLFLKRSGGVETARRPGGRTISSPCRNKQLLYCLVVKRAGSRRTTCNWRQETR